MVKTRQGWVLLSPLELLAVEAMGGATSASVVGHAASAVGGVTLASAVGGVASALAVGGVVSASVAGGVASAPDQSPSADTLIRLAELVLTLNNFSFNSSHFLQTKG
eukprot:g17469.t1